MPLTVAEANARLAQITDEEALRNLIRELDVSSPGNVTLLYSGSNARRTAITLLSQGENVRVIDNTEASRFLDVRSNETLRNKLIELFKSDPRDPDTTAFRFLDGDIFDDERIPNGAFGV